MSEVSICENWTEVFNRKLDKIINLCEKNAEEITYLHKRIDELSKDKLVKESKSLYHNPITEEELILNIDKGIFDPELEGREVLLKEGEDDVHDWIIIRVNPDSYDLWYSGDIGEAEWKGSDNDRYWINNDPIDTKYVKGLCYQYKSKLSSSIQDRLKTGLNVNCGISTVVILSAKQLGYTGIDCLNDDNTAIPYFNSKSRRSIGQTYWASSAVSNYSHYLWRVNSDGAFDYGYCDYSHGIVPAIRIGM